MRNWEVRMNRKPGMNAGHNQTKRVEYVTAATQQEAMQEANRRQKNYKAIAARPA